MNTNTIIHGDFRDYVIPSEAFFISDPPYNQKYHYGIYGDNLPTTEYSDLLLSAFDGKRSVIVLYPEETINLLGGGYNGCRRTGGVMGVQLQHRKAISPYQLVELQA